MMRQDQQTWWIATAGAGALALAAAVTWHKHTQAKQVAGNSGVRVGLIGTGWAVQVQLPQFRRAGLDVTAIASRNQSRAISLSAEHHIANPFGDVISLCQSTEVDVVSIVTPPYLHAEQMIAALVGGKHVVVDKPMARNAEEAERMLSAASAHSQQVAIVDHELRFTAAFQCARQLLLDGAIGAVALIEVSSFLPGLGPKWSWWSDKMSGGGVLGALGSHVIDAHRFLLDCEFTSLSAHLQTIMADREDETTGRPRACTADDYASVQYKLQPRRGSSNAPVWGPNASIQGHVSLSLVGVPPPSSSLLRIVGTRGSIEIDMSSASMTAREKGTGAKGSGKVIASVKGKGNASAVEGTYGLAVALQQALVPDFPQQAGPEQDRAALRQAATIADGLAVMYVMDAARQSSEEGGAWKTPRLVPTD